ncbi:adenosylcobinamide-GDP ribazoletransferase [Nocardia callitridis]|uniref:adenosylcobinamide-GDP ribazoletransferase n=1 Tax=Nocardia callitridis TaxID=648753 RepID=UPI0031E631EB
MTGLRLALSWLTVLPVGGPESVDRPAAARAIACAPVVGGVLGGMAAAALWALTAAGASAPLSGLLVVAIVALLTRGMHLDGLADTMDGLGTYGSPQRAREVMKRGDVGPFGVTALVFAIGVQAFAFTQLAQEDRWLAVVVAVALGRVAVVLACRLGIDAAPESGFGSLVAGTQRVGTYAGWSVLIVIVSVFALPEARWLGPVAVAVTLAFSVLLVRHCVRRFGGLSGDVLGAVVEISVALVAVGLCFGA